MIKPNVLSIEKCLKDNLSLEEYDAFFATIGYEERSSYLAQNFKPKAKKKFATGFDKSRVLNYNSNKKWYKTNKFLINEISDEDYINWVRHEIKILANKKKNLKFVFDISSVTRTRMASIVEALSTIDTFFAEVDFFYSYSEFFKPSNNLNSPIEHSGPVIPFFAGWSVNPEMPLSAIIGMGFEGNMALGICEYLELQNIFPFIPTGHDKKFDEVINDENKILTDLLERYSASKNINYYMFDEPYSLLLKLESLAYGLIEKSRPIIIPFGPKIFSLISLLISCIYYPKIGVWRVSSGSIGAPTERKPSGKVVGLRVLFGQK